MKRILTIVISLICCLSSYSQERTDSLSLKVYFRRDVSKLELEYRNNQALIDNFVSSVKDIISNPEYRIQDIVIRSSASPEGEFNHNKDLSIWRGRELKEHLQRALLLSDDKFIIDAVGEDWATLRKIVEKNPVPDKEKILDILDRHSDFVNGRPTSYIGSPKKELQDLNGGKTWFWLLDNIYPDLRSAGNNIVCRYTRPAEPVPAPQQQGHIIDTVVIIHEYPVPANAGGAVVAGAPIYNNGQGYPNGYPNGEGYGQGYPYGYPNGQGYGPDAANYRKPRKVRKGPGYQFALKTNLLVDALISPNVELEFPIGKRVSLLANHNFPWFVFDNDRYAIELLNTGGEVRYWFGDRMKRPVLTGAYIGLYGAALKSDLEYKSVGNQVPYTWQAGVSGGWSFPLGKRQNWRFDLGLSLGYIPYTYYHYERSEVTGLLMYKYTDKGTWIGPTNLRCSIAWMIPPHKKVKNDNASNASDITSQDNTAAKEIRASQKDKSEKVADNTKQVKQDKKAKAADTSKQMKQNKKSAKQNRTRNEK